MDWIMDSIFGLDLMFWNFSGLPTVQFLIVSSLVPKIRFLCILSAYMVGLGLTAQARCSYCLDSASGDR